MANGNNHRVWNRRSVLRNLSGVAVASGVSSTAIAAADSDTGIEHRAFDSPMVESLLSDLDNPSVEETHSEIINIENVDLGFVKIRTNIGQLSFIEIEDYRNGAQFSFRESESVAEMPKKYEEIPHDSNPVLIGHENDCVFRRSATEREIHTLRQMIDISGEADVIAGTDITDFLIIEREDSEAIRKRDVVIDETFDSRVDELGGNFRINRERVTVSPSQRGITPAASCETWAFRCVASGASCAACSSSCAGVATGIGAVACVACIQGVCTGVGGTACAAAIGRCLG